MKIGKRVVQLRERIGWSQNELARRAGISQSTLSDIENNVNGPNSSTLYKLANALGCTPNDLLEESEEIA